MVGVSEYYTLKKCLDCQYFAAQVTLRRFYCIHCERYYRRDVMAAENMCKTVQGYLVNQQRPLYLQPVTEDGRHPLDLHIDCRRRDEHRRDKQLHHDQREQRQRPLPNLQEPRAFRNKQENAQTSRRSSSLGDSMVL